MIMLSKLIVVAILFIISSVSQVQQANADESTNETFQCGVGSPSMERNWTNTNRIGLAQVAFPGEFPFIVRLTISGSNIYCGAVVIREQFILTAARCVDAWSKFEFRDGALVATIGHHGSSSENRNKIVDIVGIEMGSDYCRESYNNDLAILVLSKRTPAKIALYSKGYGSVNSICLPYLKGDNMGSRFTLAGWGGTTGLGSRVDELHRIEVRERSFELCGVDGLKSRICAGTGAYHGDIGSPLMKMIDHNRWELVGIKTEFAGIGGNYGIFTRVDQYLDWIWDVIYAYNNNLELKQVKA